MNEKKIFFVVYLSIVLAFSIVLFGAGAGYPQSDTGKKEDKKAQSDSPDKSADKNGAGKPGNIIKYMKEKEWYKQRKEKKEKKQEIKPVKDETDLSSIKEGASEEINNIIVLLSEIPKENGRNPLIAPVFLSDQKDIFGTKTDFSLKWVGYKLTLNCKQKEFPSKKLTLSETIIGSFLYASGTNLGFSGGSLREEKRFFTNYTSEIVALKWGLPLYTSVALTLDSRQYFFVERDTPDNFIMPKNHVNFFPRIDLIFNKIKEIGIDQLADGIKLTGWIGYGVRSRWEQWGEPPKYEMGEKARTFIIYSGELTAGLLLHDNHNFVLCLHYKGGVDNDFLTRPRFGGTIDNANLDVVHGFTIDAFRVKSFGLGNFKYGFNIFSRLRMNFFCDYARIFETDKSPLYEHSRDIIGGGYGFRIIAWGGLPIWLTHGIGRKLTPERQPAEQVFMIMTAAGW